jgi:hypothetical protein
VRATPFFRTTVALLAGLAAASAASAGGPAAGDPARTSTNSFTLVVAAAPQTAATVPSMGVGVPTKPVVSNPYNVPLIRNAGSLGAR